VHSATVQTWDRSPHQTSCTLEIGATDPDPNLCASSASSRGPEELDMTLDPFSDETARVMEPTQRQLEHHAGACRSSALVLTLEGLPDQAAAYLARAAHFEVQLGQTRSPALAFTPDSAG
jgi:hypothetical protein